MNREQLKWILILTVAAFISLVNTALILIQGGLRDELFLVPLAIFLAGVIVFVYYAEIRLMGVEPKNA